MDTKIENIREMAIAFLYTDIKQTEFYHIATHPFTNSWYVVINKNIVDLHVKENLIIWRESVVEIINKSNLLTIFSLLNKAYILNFLKFCVKYINADDLGIILQTFWNKIEQISLDKSITHSELVKMFKRANKKTLMTECELSYYNSLPEYVTVYRGVTAYNRKCKNAFSWTLDRSTAEWFANRFGTGYGEIWSLTIQKDRILCYFSSRNENEVVVDVSGMTKMISVNIIKEEDKNE